MDRRLTIETASIGAFVFGITADIALNVVTKQDWTPDVGLKDYFVKHGALESVFIAGGLLFGSMFTGLTFWGGDVNRVGTVPFLFAYGALLDVAFRRFRLMPTLDSMYNKLHPLTSILWAGGPLVLAYYTAKLLVRA